MTMALEATEGVLALVNAVGAGIVVVMAAEVATRLSRGAPATARHAAWWLALLVVVLLPLRELASLAGGAAPVPAPPGAPAVAAAAAPLLAIPEPAEGVAGGVLVVLAAVALLRVASLARSLRRLRALKRGARELPGPLALRLEPVLREHARRAVRVRLSDAVTGPAMVGFLHPVVLLPARLLPVLGEREWAQVALHELAHARRRDDWSNLLQRLLEAVLFFHPAVYWAARRLELEREMACDEYVVAAGGDARGYARCLTRLVEARGSDLALAPGVVARRGQLSRRVEALLAPRARPGGGSARPALPLAAAALALAALLPGLPRVVFLAPPTSLAAIAAAPDPVVAPATDLAFSPATRVAAVAPAPGRAAILSAPVPGPRVTPPEPEPLPSPTPRLAIACGPGCEGPAAGAILGPVTVEREDAEVTEEPRRRRISLPAIELAIVLPGGHALRLSSRDLAGLVEDETPRRSPPRPPHFRAPDRSTGRPDAPWIGR